MVHLPARQGRRAVVLGVSGGEEHQGYGGDFGGPVLGEAVHALGDRRPGELDKASLHRQRRVSPAHEADEVVELPRTARVAATMAYYEERRIVFLYRRSVLSRIDRVPHVIPPRSRSGRSTPPPRRRSHLSVRGSRRPAGHFAVVRVWTRRLRRSRP